MKIIESKTTEKYKEITVEKRFGPFKWRTTYRKVKHVIFKYSEKYGYQELGVYEYTRILPFFAFCDNTITTK